jgi:hypothetical protein
MRAKMFLFVVLAICSGIVGRPNRVVHGQAQSRQLLGQAATWQGSIDRGEVTDKLMLTFQAIGDPQLVAVEFSTTYPLQGSLPAPATIQMVITELPVGESTPEISVQANGQTSAIATRLRSRRSISTFLSVDELEQLAKAEVIIAHPFSDQLRFSPEQTRKLQAVAAEWTTRLRR